MYVQIKTGIEFALVCEHKDLAFLLWDIFCTEPEVKGVK